MNFEKEYKYTFKDEKEIEYNVIHKVKVNENNEGRYNVLLEYKIENEDLNEDLYISALEYETKKLMAGKRNALITEENIFEETFGDISEKKETYEISEVVSKIENIVLKTAGITGLSEKEPGGIFVRKAESNYRRKRNYNIADMEKLILTGDGKFDSYFITLGNYQLESTPISFSFSINQKNPLRKIEVFHTENNELKSFIYSPTEKCQIGENKGVLSVELTEGLKKSKTIFENAIKSSMITYSKKNIMLKELEEAILKQENQIKTENKKINKARI